MNKFAHLREKAVTLRLQGYSLSKIVEMLGLAKTTIYYWIKDIKVAKFDNSAEKTNYQKGRERTARINSNRARVKREEAYFSAKNDLTFLLDKAVRQFGYLYLCEGYRKCRNVVSIANSNPAIIKFSHEVMKKYSRNKIFYTIQIHIDNDENELKQYWASLLDIDPSSIKVIRKSNSGNLTVRKWRSVYGVFTVGANDTYFRSKIEAVLDSINEELNTTKIT